MLTLTALRRLPAALALVSALAVPAGADILDTVTASGMLRFAVVTDYPPFGSIGTDMKAVGYDIELAELMAKHLGFKVELVPVSSANKIPYLIAKRADVLFNIGFNEERAKVVDFAEPYAPYYIGVFGPSDVKVPALPDLVGKSVATTRGSFEELILSRTAPAGTDIKRYEDNATTISAFMSGQTQLIAIGNIVAAALVAQKPARLPEQKLLLLNSPVRAAVVKGEERLLAKINGAIAQLKKDGTLAKMSERWLKQPLPESF